MGQHFEEAKARIESGTTLQGPGREPEIHLSKGERYLLRLEGGKRGKKGLGAQATAILKHMQERCTQCALCGKSASHGAIFLPAPEDQAAFGGFESHSRFFPFGLCDTHARNFDRSMDEAERLILNWVNNPEGYRSFRIDAEGSKTTAFVAGAPAVASIH
jgi:hypothetical protein